MNASELDSVVYAYDNRAGLAKVVDYNTANYILYDMLYGLEIQGNFSYCVEGTSVDVQAVYYRKLNVTALYLHARSDLRTLTNHHSLRVSRIQYGPDLAPYGLVTHNEVLNYAFFITKRTKYIADRLTQDYDDSGSNGWPVKDSIIRSWFAGHGEPVLTKISQAHLRHLTVHEVRKKGWDYYFPRLSFLLPFLNHMAGIGMHESMFVGILTWADLLHGDSFLLAKYSGIWHVNYTSVEQFFNKIKLEFSLRLKALQNVVAVGLEQFFELEVLVNRGLGEVDWKKEKTNRVKPKLANVPKEFVYSRAMNLFNIMKSRGARHKKYYWKGFWEQRWAWAPTGVAHSQYPEDLANKPKDSRLRSKWFMLCAQDNCTIDKYLSRNPSIHAWPSVKYEWGKQRAIYGVDMTNFIMTSFCLPNIEEVMSSYFPIGEAAEAERVKKDVAQVLENGVPYCFDFEDFNSQHSVESMQAVLLAYSKVFGQYFSEEQASAFDWVLQSLDYQYVKDGDSWYRTVGTLLSGWRLTTAINTMLNKIYTMYCTIDEPIVSIHNGDDILAAVTTIEQISRLENKAKASGIRFQRQKCYLASIAEFLRVDHKSGSNAQYLARGVSTFVHGPTETALPNDLLAVLKSNHTRAGELIARGADADKVWSYLNLQIDHLAGLWHTERDKLDKIMSTHISLGGFSQVVDEKSTAFEIVRDWDDDESGLDDVHEEDKNIVMHGAVDYARMVCRHMVAPEYEQRIAKRIKKSLFSSVKKKKLSTFIKKTTSDINLYVRISTFGMFKSKQNSNKAIVAKTYGVPLFAVNIKGDMLLERLAEEADKLAAYVHFT